FSVEKLKPGSESWIWASKEVVYGLEEYGCVEIIESVMCFSKRLEEIYETVMRMVFEKYGVDQGDRFESFKNSSFHLLRMVKYKVREKGDSNVALIDHRDSTILSILHQNQINGLQIKTKHGHWIPVLKPNSTSSFIVLAGEGLMAWSNDRVRGCEHRVMLNDLMEMKNKERYSVALFTFINGVVDVPKEFVDDEHPLQFLAWIEDMGCNTQ
ncbi:hypothetical protein G4B88_022812, partial [Cannabis sativa]